MERIAILSGVRTPFCKAGGPFREIRADDLGVYAVEEAFAQSGIDRELVDEVIMGNVLQPPHATNVARVITVKAGLPHKIPAFTVNRNCASSMEAIVSAGLRIWIGEIDVAIAGGTESMSQFPILFPQSMGNFLKRLSKAKSIGQRISTLLSFRPSLLKPDIPTISDPLCGLTMGQTAEVLAREFKIPRKDQDVFALRSHQRAQAAIESGKFASEIIPVPLPPKFMSMQVDDVGPRFDQTLEALEALKPIFDRVNGTVTAGSSSQVTDGAAAVVLMRESLAKKMGLEPLGYLVDYSSAGVDPERMGLGPVFATAKLLAKTGRKLDDFELIEINEAFAAQVLAVERAMASKRFAQEQLGQGRAIGEIDPDRLNVNGGAIALGHPIGTSGTRIILTLLKEMKRRDLHLGIAALCVGGGQGEAVILER